MHKVARILFIIGAFSLVANNAFAAENWLSNFKDSWISPFFIVTEEFNDNIFLEEDDTNNSDWITTLTPGFVLEPPLKEHRFRQDYRCDIKLFAEHNDEDSVNHEANTELELNYNNFRINLDNAFRFFTDPLGIEETGRIPRRQDHAGAKATFLFNKFDVAPYYKYRMEDYRTNDPIGTYHNMALNYEDLERDEHSWGTEAAFKLWPKTALLAVGEYGIIDHDSGRKSDSDYYMILGGLRGQPTAKMTVEAKAGFREQDYDDYDDDYTSLVFYGTVIEDFNDRDTMRIDFIRTPQETNYQENAYYESSYLNVNYKHRFTERIYGSMDAAYQLNYYPTETTEGAQTDNRTDHFWSTGLTYGYEMPIGLVCELRYIYRARKSEFTEFDYGNNRLMLSLAYTF